MDRRKFIRLGLFQMTAGALSVLFLGVLNRVMRVELGLDLLTVSILVGGGHYLGALVAIPFGYYSDSHPVAGYRRTVYIILGSLVTASVLVSSPWVAGWIAESPTILRIGPGFLFFLLEGISTFVAGTAYLALITDLTDSDQRGQVTSLVWTLLMVGIILTGVLSGFVLDPFRLTKVVVLFTAAAGGAVLLTLLALWRQEPRYSNLSIEQKGNLGEALRGIISNPPARWFGAFLFLSMFSYFMQDVLLEPFGGEVFGLAPSETTRFNAYMGTGVVLGMLLGGMRLIPRRGKKWTTSLGILLMIPAFGGLAASSLSAQAAVLPAVILLLGLGSGFFTVGGVSLMMDMTSAVQAGLFVGAWTLIQAAAKGPTAIVGGAIQTGLISLGLSPPGAYAGVFLIEGLGLLLALIFLQRVTIAEFQQRTGEFSPASVETTS